DRRRWLGPRDFEDAFAACQLLPGPASTQLAIYCALRVRGRAGALAGGLAFILPGLLATLAIGALALSHDPPAWIRGVGAGAAAAVVAVTVQAGVALARPALAAGPRARPLAYVAAGAAATLLAGSFVVLVLLAFGVVEL